MATIPTTTLTARPTESDSVTATGVSATPAVTTNNVIDTVDRQETNDIGTTKEQNTKCAISLKDYETVRREMKKEIDDYYANILGVYTDSYEKYLNKINSPDQDDVDYAMTQLKPKVIGYNTQLINVNKKLIDRVNDVSKLIDEQKANLETNRDEINDNNVKIDKLEQRKLQLGSDINGNERYLKEISNKTDTDNVYKYVYIGINLLLLIIIISILVYMLY